MNDKRETLKKVAGVSAVVALAPSSWTKPVLKSVILPAHAQTSAVLSLDAVDDILINADRSSDDPRASIILQPMTQGASYQYTFNVIEGSGITENTVFSLINNPTIGGNIGNLIIGEGLFAFLNWNIFLSKFGPAFEDVFPSGDFLISVLAENPDGALAQVNFTITWL